MAKARLTAAGLCLILFSYAWCGTDSPQNAPPVKFSVGTTSALLGVGTIRVPLSISGVPSTSAVKAFGCTVSFNRDQLAFLGVRRTPGLPIDLYASEPYGNAQYTYLDIEGFSYAKSGFTEENTLELLFYPTIASEVNPATLSKSHYFCPVRIVREAPSWAELSGYSHSIKVKKLRNGGVDFYLGEALEFGRTSGKPGSTVRVPISLTNPGTISLLGGGVDYDDSILKLQDIEIAPQIRRYADRVLWSNYEGYAYYELSFDAEGLPPDTHRAVLYLVFRIREDAIPNTHTPVGSGASGSCTTALGNTTAQVMKVGAVVIEETPPSFIRGEVNGDGRFTVADPVCVLQHIFTGSPGLTCPDAADMNDDGRIQIDDATRLLSFIFRGKPAPSSPYPDQGVDPRADNLPPCGN